MVAISSCLDSNYRPQIASCNICSLLIAAFSSSVNAIDCSVGNSEEASRAEYINIHGIPQQMTKFSPNCPHQFSDGFLYELQANKGDLLCLSYSCFFSCFKYSRIYKIMKWYSETILLPGLPSVTLYNPNFCTKKAQNHGMQLNMLQDVYFHQHGPIKYTAQILTLEYI